MEQQAQQTDNKKAEKIDKEVIKSAKADKEKALKTKQIIKK